MQSRFLLLKASAGSGKTFNLALQYIALLLVHGEREYRHTLAVTFTNKATAEMKDRILQFLYNFWKGTGDKDAFRKCKEILRETYQQDMPDEEIRERSHRALHAILHDYSRFCVSTIDAFFQSVLRNMAHELGLNARLQVDLDDKDVIELAVENFMEELGDEGKEERGERREERGTSPRRWLQQYIEQQLADGRPWDVRRELKHMAGMLFQEEYLKRSLQPDNKPFDLTNIAQFKKTLATERRKAVDPIKQSATQFEETLRKAGYDYEDFFNYQADVRKYIESMKDGHLEATFGKRLTDMVDDPKKMLKSALRKDPSLHPIAEALSNQLEQLHKLHEKGLHKTGSIELALANLSPIGLLGAIDDEITRLSNERNRFMLARTPIMLKRMIGNDDASFIFERTGTQFRNIMIDEFQDTSQLQWENFRTLLLDNLASGGLSMIVGDIKQSIYRWRNGDWHILQGLGRDGYNGVPLKEEPLDVNFRSLGRIVTFNNRFFRIAADKLDLLAGNESHQLRDLYADVEQQIDPKKDKEGGYVRIRICRSDQKETIEAWTETMLADLCAQVRCLHDQGLPYEEMTILLRKNRFINPVISYFAKHIPEVQLVSNEAFLLGASVAVNMVVNALQMVDDIERDPVAVRYVAKHYLQDVQHREITESDAMLPSIGDILPEAFMQHLEELRLLPLYELCEKLYRLLDIHEIEQQDAYLFCFFDELANYLRDNPSDIPTFLQYWNDNMCKIAIPNGESQGIRIYTIHKSKGLAFHTVLMPFTEWDIEKDMQGDLYWCSPQEEPLNQMGTLPIKFSSKKIQDTVFEPDYIVEHANRRADELNTLYVAFTRAKVNLLVWGLSKGETREDEESGKKVLGTKLDETTADLLYVGLDEVEGITVEKEDEESPFTTYSFGGERNVFNEQNPQPSILNPQSSILNPQSPNPQSPNPQSSILNPQSSIQMQSYEGGFTFRQSGEAEKFVRQAGEEADIDSTTLDYIEQGKLLHYIFSQIHTSDDISHVVRQFSLRGILKTEEQEKHVRELALRGLRHERVQDWFSGRYRLFNECNILVPDDNGKLKKKRPDRVMMSSERIIVVDFKFGRENEDYKTQVKEYKEILQSMYPDRQVEGWLWYVYKNKVEEIRD